MNITLIYPLLSKKRAKIDENKQFWPPLGLAYIAAVLERAGHRVQIIDRDMLLRKGGMDFDNTDLLTLDGVKNFNSDITGISATTPNMSDVKHISEYLKTNYKEVPIILGGPHPSGEPVLSLSENPFVDAVATGEGEFIMLDIASYIPFGSINGLTYRKDGSILCNPPRELIPEIDDIPMPARHLLDMKYYTRPSRFTSRNLSLRTTSIFTARGCPYRCNFCAGPIVFSGKVRFHSSARVIKEIEELIDRYSIEALYFAEDMFLSSKKRADEILNLFVERGINRKIKWFAQAKANIITDELLNLMKKAGCVGIEYGFESGSQRVLNLMNKKLKVEESIRAALLTRKAGLRFQANIIVGYPGERAEDFNQTIEFIKKIRPNMIGFNIFMPLPGTQSYKELKARGQRLPGWDDVGDPEAPQVNYADMPQETFEKLYLKARLCVILPINLRNFLVDNINNPVRLIKIAATQFGGVLIKTIRSIFKLAALNRTNIAPQKKVLFLSYNGLLEPILPSQGIPYLKMLAKEGFDITLLTYEKQKDLKRLGRQGLKDIKEELRSHGIDWHHLLYHKNPPALSTFFDLALGTLVTFNIILKKGIKLIHVRGITSGIIMLFLSGLLKVKILFDMRGLLAEEYVGAGIWKENGMLFDLVKRAEKNMLRRADAITVLTHKHLEFNKRLDYLKDRHVRMDVVPCCVDMEHFKPDPKASVELKNRLGLEGKFVLMYPGKTGTFYLMDRMLEFFKVAQDLKPTTVFLILTNDKTAPLLKMARMIGIEEGRIIIVKDVSFKEMPQYINLADAGIFFINRYKKIGSSPIKLGEFLACGIPVIINPGIGDTEEIVWNNNVGVVVKKFDGADYLAAIKELLLLKRGNGSLATRCRDAALEYLSLEKGAAKYLTIYNNLFEEKV